MWRAKLMLEAHHEDGSASTWIFTETFELEELSVMAVYEALDKAKEKLLGNPSAGDPSDRPASGPT